MNPEPSSVISTPIEIESESRTFYREGPRIQDRRIEGSDKKACDGESDETDHARWQHTFTLRVLWRRFAVKGSSDPGHMHPALLADVLFENVAASRKSGNRSFGVSAGSASCFPAALLLIGVES